MLHRIDVNCDLGEHATDDPSNYDLAILPYISSCSIGCGEHAGDRQGIAATIRAAMLHQVAIGAHPSYPDREHFGRVTPKIPRSELFLSLRRQIEWLRRTIEQYGGRLRHVKPHGALYNDLARDGEMAEAFIGLIGQLDGDLGVFGMAGTQLELICHRHGIRFVPEGFLDRRYADRDRLQPRTVPGAVVESEEAVLAQLSEFLSGRVTDVAGKSHPLRVATVCLHGDAPQAPRLAQRVHDYLQDQRVQICPA